MTLASDREASTDGAPPGLRLGSHFQPIYSLTHHRVVGHEALLRARDTQTDAAVPPLEVFARCADVDALVRLDRAARVQHLGAYASGAPGQWLFLNALPASFTAGGGWNA